MISPATRDPWPRCPGQYCLKSGCCWWFLCSFFLICDSTRAYNEDFGLHAGKYDDHHWAEQLSSFRMMTLSAVIRSLASRHGMSSKELRRTSAAEAGKHIAYNFLHHTSTCTLNQLPTLIAGCRSSLRIHDKQSRNSKHGSTEMKDIEVGPGSSDSDSDEDEAQAELDAQVSSLKRNVSRVDALIDENLHDQRRLESEILTLGDHEASAEEIKSSVEKVVNETSSPALGEMLGKMWSEMRMYAWPFYKETLEDGLDKLKDEEKQLQRRLAQAEDRLEMAEAKQRRNQAAEADTDEANERKVEKTPDEGSDDADGMMNKKVRVSQRKWHGQKQCTKAWPPAPAPAPARQRDQLQHHHQDWPLL